MASPATKGVIGCGIAAIAVLAWSHFAVRSSVAALAERITALETQVHGVFGEVTRIRIEQRTGKQGPDALLERLQTYAPLLTSARTTQPDYSSARQEMDAILRAFATLGRDGFAAV